MTTYYAAVDGKEEADGLSPETPTTLKRAVQLAGDNGGDVHAMAGYYAQYRVFLGNGQIIVEDNGPC